MADDKPLITPKERITELKQLKQLANQYLDFYRRTQRQPPQDWQRELSDRNISLLKNIVANINRLLRDDKISEYIAAAATTAALPADASEKEKEKRSREMWRNFAIVMDQNPSSLLLKINQCSPRLSYFNDLTWFEHGTVHEHLDYGLHKCDESVFEKYLPYQVERISKTKKSFFTAQKYKDDEILLDSVLVLIKEEQNVAANVLVITLIEGLVRKFCLEVYKKQNPDVPDEAAERFAYNSHHSLASLISDLAWKADIPVSFSELLVTYKHTNHPVINAFELRFHEHMRAQEKIRKKVNAFEIQFKQELNQSTITDEFSQAILKHVRDLNDISNHLLKKEEQTVWIGLNVYLNFLVSQFTSERNQIIHGKYSFFKEKWKTLVYLTALQKVMDKIMQYQKIAHHA